MAVPKSAITFLAMLGALVVCQLSFAQNTPALIEAAKPEGEVMFYGAITINSSKAIGDLFEKKYGIKLRHWRGAKFFRVPPFPSLKRQAVAQ